MELPQRTPKPAFIQRIVDTFPNVVILDPDFRILAASHDVEEILELTTAEIKGKPIALLSNDVNLAATLAGKLSTRCFRDYESSLIKKDKTNVPVCVSGFYITDCHDNFIIIRIESLCESTNTATLRKVTRQLDCFVHSAWHDLRGPVATILGIITLIETRKDDSEINFLAELIKKQTHKLDDQLRTILNDIHGMDKAGR